MLGKLVAESVGDYLSSCHQDFGDSGVTRSKNVKNPSGSQIRCVCMRYHNCAHGVETTECSRRGTSLHPWKTIGRDFSQLSVAISWSCANAALISFRGSASA